MEELPVSIVAVNSDLKSFDLVVSGVRYSELLKRWAKIKERGLSVMDLNAPITEGDQGCDFSGVGSGVDKLLFKERI